MLVGIEGSRPLAEEASISSLSPILAATWNETTLWLQQRPHVSVPVALALLTLAAWASLALCRALALPALRAFVRRSPTRWDDIVLEHGTLDRLTYAVPALVVHQGIAFVQSLPPSLALLAERLALASLALVAARATAALLAAVNEIYNDLPQAKERPIKGILQVGNVLVHLAAGLFIVAALLDRSPLLLLSGLGAMTAILMLVFRDSLLSLVAGVQITTNGLIRMGDWIEMPQFMADGDVVDIALNTISVQNWDKTITVIPAHKFLEHSFKNWRGMYEAGGRRIKRSIFLDVSSIRFLTDEEVDRFERFHLLSDYIAEKRRELAAYNEAHVRDPSLIVNVRKLTNIGTFRAYVSRYLAQHPGINQEMYKLVRQLHPTGEGLPLELYCFTSDMRWNVYEGVQADIFDHLFAVIPQFGLRVFQQPSGSDFAALVGQAEAPSNVLGAQPPASLAPQGPASPPGGPPSRP